MVEVALSYGSDRDNADNGIILCMRKHVFRVIFIYFYLFYPLFFYFLGQFILIFTSTLTLEIKGDTGWQKSRRKNVAKLLTCFDLGEERLI